MGSFLQQYWQVHIICIQYCIQPVQRLWLHAPDEATFPALQGKHPPLHPSAIPSLQEGFLPHPIQVTAKDIVKVHPFLPQWLGWRSR